VTSYIKAEPREPAEVARLDRVLRGLGDVTLGEINQETMDGLRDKLLQPGASPATITRAIITPVRTVMRHAHRRGWCDPPLFEIPRQPKGRTLYMLPEEVERLVAAAAAHLEPIVLFLIDTGARVSECLSIQWRDVDLGGARAILWVTKNGRRRDVPLGPRTIAALASLPHRDGAVFRWSLRRGAVELTRAYADQGLGWGGQIKKAWAGAIRRAGLDPAFTPHVLRHSWASWHYAVHHDLLLLKRDGDWSSVTLVERYAHLLPAGHDAGIAAFWGAARAGFGHQAETTPLTLPTPTPIGQVLEMTMSIWTGQHPCQGRGRGFESPRPLQQKQQHNQHYPRRGPAGTTRDIRRQPAILDTRWTPVSGSVRRPRKPAFGCCSRAAGMRP